MAGSDEPHGHIGPSVNGSGGSVRWAAMTHPGHVRDNNEDSYAAQARPGVGGNSFRFIAAVADGMGGHESGEVASKAAIDSVCSAFVKWDGQAPDNFVGGAARQANNSVFQAAHTSPKLFNMQTTLTTVVVAGDKLAVAHVGDCRLYRLRGGQFDVLTKDHSVAMEMLQLHMITLEEAAEHPGRYQLTRSVGGEPFLRADVTRDKVAIGDRYLLCSDGLWSVVGPEELREVTQRENLPGACQDLVDLALAGGGPDNITAVLFEINDVVPDPPVSMWNGLLRRGKP